MFCGSYPEIDDFGNCVEERKFATICRNCMKHGRDKTDCAGNDIPNYCNGDCEFNSRNKTCLRKSSKVIDF